jgi:hypothetical protein
MDGKSAGPAAAGIAFSGWIANWSFTRTYRRSFANPLPWPIWPDAMLS